MKNLTNILSERISAAMAAATGLDRPDAMVAAAKDAKFGDYQANGVMALAKKVKTNPRELAQKVIEQLQIDDICETPEIAGPGFINLRLKADFLAKVLLEINADTARLGVQKTEKKETVVVDFSGPNIAKQMHVGHLRSTILGDCICRLLDFAGNKVIPQNHIGDWGTQFGMLMAYWKTENLFVDENIEDSPVSDLERFYKNAKKNFDEDQGFAANARREVRNLQNGNEENLRIWQAIVNESMKQCYELYKELGVDLTAKDSKGESFYNNKLAGVVEELKSAGLAVESDGAVCVFPNEDKFKNKEGAPLPFIIQKSDDAFLYATTDLAAIKYRINELNANRIIYVTDARQKLHFDMLFAVARKAGWANENIKLEHVTFGSVMGEDGKPFKTRSGENVKLAELLDEAIQRARAVVDEKNPELAAEQKASEEKIPELADEQKASIAKAVGIGAVKYADYSNNRTSDYVFNFDRMLAMEGNTAPYMQYAYARIKSIERKAAEKGIDFEAERANCEPNLCQVQEIELAKHLARYSEAFTIASTDYKCNFITSYLYELAQKFSSFYSACPVVIAEKDKRPTRLLLCDLTARTIEHGLKTFLGIDVIKQM